jgi:predicted ATPase
MESFAKLAKECDVKVIMTTHSNFIFNKLSNLVISNSFGSSIIKSYRFEKTENGTISHPLDVDKYGITDENFTEISEKLFLEKIELIEST